MSHLRQLHFLFALAGALLLSASLAGVASAQITITEADLEKLLQRGQYGFTSLISAPGEAARIQAVLDEIGPGRIFDFSGVQTSASFTEAEVQTRPFGPDVPTDPAFADADVVNVVSVLEESTYSFSLLNGSGDGGPDGLYELGDVTQGLITTTFDPPLRRLPSPMTAGTEWSSGLSTVTESSSFFTETHTTSFSGKVVGYGTLIVPGGGQVEALVHRLVTLENDTVAVRAFEFFGKDRLLSAVVLVDKDGNVLTHPLPNGTRQPSAFFQIGTEEATRAQLSANATGSVLSGLPGGTVTLTDGSDTDGLLCGYRVGHPSSNNAIDDSGTPAGFPITNVSPEGFWVVKSEGLSSFAYTICLDFSNVPGVSDPSKLAVLKRADAGSMWIPQVSTINSGSQQVCAKGLSSFSEFAIGGGAENPLPVELVAFTGEYDAGDKAVRLRWQTASETGNAGFALERHTEAGNWSEVAFVEGAGTTSTPQSYRFADRNLPFAAESLTYRLRQVDLDGTTAHSAPVTVALGIPNATRLHSIFPNPVRGEATVRYEVAREGEVQFEVYDLLGRRVRSIARPQAAPGRSEVRLDTRGLPSGTYFVRFQAGDLAESKRIIVLR